MYKKGTLGYKDEFLLRYVIVNVNKHTLRVSIFSCTKPLRNISLAVIGVLLPLTILTNII